MVKYDHDPMNIVLNKITPIDRVGDVGRSNSIGLFHNLVWKLNLELTSISWHLRKRLIGPTFSLKKGLGQTIARCGTNIAGCTYYGIRGPTPLSISISHHSSKPDNFKWHSAQNWVLPTLTQIKTLPNVNYDYPLCKSVLHRTQVII